MVEWPVLFLEVLVIINNTMIYLYLKTHNKTGLKYLGKTKNSPFSYKGSGKRWTNHLKKHGNDVTTEILKECLTNEEVKYWGLIYSSKWNIVDNVNFANLKEESGDGGAVYRDAVINAAVSDKLKQYNKTLSRQFLQDRASSGGKVFWNKVKADPELREKISKARKQQVNPMQGKKQKRICCIQCKKDLPINQLKTHSCE